MTGPARGGVRGLVAAALASLVVLVVPGVAGAHAILLSTSPEPGALVDEAPPAIELRFNEPVSIARDAVVVLDPSGARLGGIDTELDGTTVVAALPPLEATGSYTVGWRVVSADGHPLRGAYLFHVEARTLTEPLEVGVGDAAGVADALRAVGTSLALLGLVAVVVAPLLRGRPRARPERTAVWPWNAVALGTLLVLGAAVLSVGSGPADSLRVVLDTASGRVALLTWGVALVGLLAAALRAPDAAVVAVAVAVAVGIGLGGHAVSLPPLWRSAPLTVAHVLAALVWLVALVWLWRRLDGDDAAVERRAAVTPWALGAVVVLGVTGTVLVLDRVPPGELTSSGYGRGALVKVALLVVAVGLALWNRSRRDVARLRAGLRVEAVVLAAALVAGTVLAQVSPPGGVAEGGPFLDRVPFGPGQVELSVEPGTRGTNELHVIAFDPDGRLMDVEELTVALTLPAEDLGPLEPELTEITRGHVTSYAQIPLAGRWTVEVTGRLSRFESLEATFEVDVGP